MSKALQAPQEISFVWTSFSPSLLKFGDNVIRHSVATKCDIPAETFSVIMVIAIDKLEKNQLK